MMLPEGCRHKMLEIVESCKIPHERVGAGVTLCHSVDLNPDPANGTHRGCPMELRCLIQSTATDSDAGPGHELCSRAE